MNRSVSCRTRMFFHISDHAQKLNTSKLCSVQYVRYSPDLLNKYRNGIERYVDWVNVRSEGEPQLFGVDLTEDD